MFCQMYVLVLKSKRYRIHITLYLLSVQVYKRD